jgi:general secretion pathway protein I
MVALGLLAAALAAVADLTGNALRNHEYARDLSAATLLARAKMVELEQKYEDEGFSDFDQEEAGDFADAARPDVRWQARVLRPDPDLSADQLVSQLAGSGTDPQQLIAGLMGGAATGAVAGTGQGGPTSTATGPLAAAAGALIQSQLTAFGEVVKKSFREVRLTVSWRDGALSRAFTVTTHLLVLNPRAPGGVRGDDPEVPANLGAAAAAPLAAPAGSAQKTSPGGAPASPGGPRP